MWKLSQPWHHWYSFLIPYLSETGKLYSWGSNIQNVKQLTNAVPTLIEGDLKNEEIEFVFGGNGHTVALTSSIFLFFESQNPKKLSRGEETITGS